MLGTYKSALCLYDLFRNILPSSFCQVLIGFEVLTQIAFYSVLPFHDRGVANTTFQILTNQLVKMAQFLIKLTFIVLQEDKPVIYFPLHFSHFDYILLSLIMYHSEVRAPFVASGNNLLIQPFRYSEKARCEPLLQSYLCFERCRQSVLSRKVS